MKPMPIIIPFDIVVRSVIMNGLNRDDIEALNRPNSPTAPAASSGDG